MKKILSTLALGAMSLCAFAQSPKIMAKIVNNSGGNAYIAICVDNSNDEEPTPYTAYGIDIQLPSGSTVTSDPILSDDDSDGVYYLTNSSRTPNHIINSSFGKVDATTLRVASISEANHAFENISGELFRFGASNISSASDIKIVNVDLIEKPMASFKVTGEGDVDVDDVQYLLDFMIGDIDDPSFEGLDVNGDGDFDIDDVQFLLDYLIGAIYE